MTRGNKKGRPHLPQTGDGQTGEIVSRRRGRPLRQIGVEVSYRPRTPEEENATNESVRLLLREMVRKRMGST